MAEDMPAPVPYKPGDRVVIATHEAQAQVGADHGVVVGDTGGQPHADDVKVIVALDAPQPTTALISPADLATDAPAD